MKENSIKEDINYLNSMVKEYKQFGNLYNEEYEDEDRIYQALEHLIKAYKELEKYYEEQNEVNAKFIPVSLLEEKIEELKENGYWNYLEERDLETTIGILQELLEKR